MLTLTKTEMWEVPKENVEAVKKAAAEHGADATPARQRLEPGVPLGARRHEDERQAEDHDGPRQGLQVDHGGRHDGRADGADGRVCADQGCRTQHRRPATSKDAARITVKLSDKTVLTIVRTSVDIKPDMCIWRGTVEGTDAPATHHVVAGRQDGRHGPAPGPHLFDPAHGRRDACRRRDGRGSRCRRSMRRCPSACAPTTPTCATIRCVNEGDASILRPVTQRHARRRRLQAQGEAAADGQATKWQAPAQGQERRRPARRDIVIDVIVAYTKKAAAQLRRRQARARRPRHRGGQRVLPHEQPRPRQAAARARLSDRLRRGGRALRPRLALRRQGRRLHGGDPRPARQASRRRRAS